jgi:hypothetical protein
MKKLIMAIVALGVLTSGANAGESYTYHCRVGNKTYPVTVTTPDESLEGGTITWRGVVYRNVKLAEGCRYNFHATSSDGVTLELCTATKGVRRCNNWQG